MSLRQLSVATCIDCCKITQRWVTCAASVAVACLVGSAVIPALGAEFEPLTTLDGSHPSPAGGGGDSLLPIISPDGRYLLFASTANNLLLITNGNSLPALSLTRLNVFLRDRASNTTTLVSVNMSNAGGGNADSIPIQISTNGQFALFESSASNLISGDTNGVVDVFLRDLASGITSLISTNSSGGVGNGISRGSMMTPDGRFVAFVSAATNLVTGDTNRIPDVFVRDVQAGTTVLASKGAISTNFSLLGSSSESPDITPDGRYVAFSSTATNLVSGLTNSGDVYVRDLVGNTTIWASVHARTLFGTPKAISYNHAISDDGNFIAYETSTNALVGVSKRGIILRYNVSANTTDLVNANAIVSCANYEEIRSLSLTPDGRFIAFIGNTNGASAPNFTNCIYLWDAQGGTTLISADLNGKAPMGLCDWPLIDSSGRYVAFFSTATNLVTNSLSGNYNLYMRDTLTHQTRLIATDTNGIGSPLSPAAVPVMSADGRFVVFGVLDPSLFPNDSNRDYDLLIRDLMTDSLDLISSHDPALPSLTLNGPSTLSQTSISSDGRFLAFVSEADNLASNDTNGCRDVFLRDRVLGTNFVVSLGTNGMAGDFGSADPSITADGRRIAFASAADNLVDGDANSLSDVFLRDIDTSATTLISVKMGGTGSGNGASYSPVVSSEGRFVLFRSKASNLATGPFSAGRENLFLRDLQMSNTYALTTAGVLFSLMTPNGNFVAFGNTNALYIWDSLAAATVYTNPVAQLRGIGLSGNGNRLVYWSGTNPVTLTAVDLAAGSNWVIATAYQAGPDIQFDHNSRFMTYLARPTLTNATQLYLYDFDSQTSTMVSRNFNTSGPVNGDCDSAAVGVDGRFIAFRSIATDVDPAATNGIPQIFLFDRLTLVTRLLSSNHLGTAAENRSLAPVFSGDGQTLFFESWASDLVGGDFNHNSDLLAYPLLYLTITPRTAVQGPLLSWPAASGTPYRVEYKNGLNDSAWQDSGGIISSDGIRAFFADPTPILDQRFYRVVAP